MVDDESDDDNEFGKVVTRGDTGQTLKQVVLF